MRNKCVPLALAMTAAMVAPAWAWKTYIEGPDVYGTVTVLASTQAGKESFVVACDSKDRLVIGLFLERPSEDVDAFRWLKVPIPHKLLVRVDDGDVKTFDAGLEVANDTHLGIMAEGARPS